MKWKYFPLQVKLSFMEKKSFPELEVSHGLNERKFFVTSFQLIFDI